MKTKHTAPNGKTYTIVTYTVGHSFGTAAEVRRGGFVARTDVFPLHFDQSAVSAGIDIADKHAARVSA